MQRLAAAFAPSEGRTSELETMRGEVGPLRTATGFVIGGTVSGLFWCLMGLAVWLVI
jgi:hypothetical protein